MSKKVLYLQYANPAAYPPLEHSSNILADNGWQVLFLGITPLGDSRSLRLPDHPHIQVKQLPSVSIGWRQKLHYLHFTLWVIFNTIRWRPDWIYASDLFSSPATLWLSFFPNLKIVYHEHDTPNEKATSAFIRVLLAARKNVAKRADICVLPNEQRSQHFTNNLSPKTTPIVVWNCPQKKEIVARNQVNTTRKLSVWYHGTIVPERVPLSLISTIAELSPDISLHIVGYTTIGHANYGDILRLHVEKLGISSRVTISKPLSHQLLLQECQKHDVGISFMPPHSHDINMQHMVGASNKAFDYLSCGLALLVSDLPDWTDLYVANGYGLACNPQEPESLTAALHWFWEHPEERQAMGTQGQRRIRDEWNYEAQFEPVLALMQGGQK